MGSKKIHEYDDLTRMIKEKFDSMKEILISKALIKFQGMNKQYVKNLINDLESKGSNNVLN